MGSQDARPGDEMSDQALPDPVAVPDPGAPHEDLRLEVAGAIERGDEYQPVSVASLTELLDAYAERDALLVERQQLIAAVDGLLDVEIRSRAGDPTLNPEEWYAIRDFSRNLLASLVAVDKEEK